MKKVILSLLLVLAIASGAFAVYFRNEAIDKAQAELVDTKISYLGEGHVEFSTFHVDTVNVAVLDQFSQDTVGSMDTLSYKADSMVYSKSISEDEYNTLKTQLDSTFSLPAYDCSLGSTEYTTAVNELYGYASILGAACVILLFASAVVWSMKSSTVPTVVNE